MGQGIPEKRLQKENMTAAQYREDYHGGGDDGWFKFSGKGHCHVCGDGFADDITVLTSLQSEKRRFSGAAIGTVAQIGMLRLFMSCLLYTSDAADE